MKDFNYTSMSMGQLKAHRRVALKKLADIDSGGASILSRRQWANRFHYADYFICERLMGAANQQVKDTAYYRCPECNKSVLREIGRLEIKSFCQETGRDTLIKRHPRPRNMLSSHVENDTL